MGSGGVWGGEWEAHGLLCLSIVENVFCQTGLCVLSLVFFVSSVFFSSVCFFFLLLLLSFCLSVVHGCAHVQTMARSTREHVHAPGVYLSAHAGTCVRILPRKLQFCGPLGLLLQWENDWPVSIQL